MLLLCNNKTRNATQSWHHGNSHIIIILLPMYKFHTVCSVILELSINDNKHFWYFYVIFSTSLIIIWLDHIFTIYIT